METIFDMKLAESIVYVIIWISIWGFVETIMEILTLNNRSFKIIAYLLLFGISTSIYKNWFDNELNIRSIKMVNDKKYINEMRPRGVIGN